MDLRPEHPLNIISLCTGGGGLDLGVELAIPSFRSVVMVEREAFACAHLVEAMRQGLMAPAPIWTDARTFAGRPWRGLVDGLIGGIPCQPHSLAGKRLGEDDARDLWSCARRIIVQSGAWWVLIENVGGMLTSGGAERVWGDLQRLGFKVEGGVFRASEVGAPHERERLFILGVADAVRGGCDGRQEGQEWGSQQRAADEWSGGGPVFPPGPDDLSSWRAVLDRSPDLEPAFRRVADGLASRLDIGRVDRLRMLGNGVVPLQAAYALRTLATDLARRSAGATELVRLMANPATESPLQPQREGA